MYSAKIILFMVVTVLLLSMNFGTHGSPFRIKRVSDHRLTELETLLALSKIKGQVMSVPVAYGKVDPDLIGRRKRSAEAIKSQDTQEKELSQHEQAHDSK